MACGEHLLDHCQSLKDIKQTLGKEAIQVSAAGRTWAGRPSLDSPPLSASLQDGLLVLHFALVLPSET